MLLCALEKGFQPKVSLSHLFSSGCGDQSSDWEYIDKKTQKTAIWLHYTDHVQSRLLLLFPKTFILVFKLRFTFHPQFSSPPLLPPAHLLSAPSIPSKG